MAKLDPELADEIAKSAVDQDLFGEKARKALLAGLNRRIVANLRVTDIPCDQIRSDLQGLNDIADKGDPQPLQRYLGNAARLAEDPTVFERAKTVLERLSAGATTGGLLAWLGRKVPVHRWVLMLGVALFLIVGWLASRPRRKDDDRG